MQIPATGRLRPKAAHQGKQEFRYVGTYLAEIVRFMSYPPLLARRILPGDQGGMLMALELRPNCECCDRDLPAQSKEAWICSYECTFCADCVENELGNVCPNCGGGFQPRPIRPATEWRAGLSLAKRPA